MEELNEKEQYYIEKYNSFNEGYNLTRGGSNGTRFDEKTWEKVVFLLQNTKKNYQEISDEIGCSVYTISDINTGVLLPSKKIDYPIRKKRVKDYFTEEDVYSVIDLLKNTSLTFGEIAEATSTNFYFVVDINNGNRNFLHETSEENFPIRKNPSKSRIDLDLAKAIIEELKKDELSYAEIAEKYNVFSFTAGQLNRGKHSLCKKIPENYPIRKKQHKAKVAFGTKLTEEKVYQILDLLLNTDLSFEEIANRFNEITKSTVNSINNKNNWTKITKDYVAPIRKHRDTNIKIFNQQRE